MTALKLPGPLKRLARSVRDTPALNNIITGAARPIVRRLPERYRTAAKAHLLRVGEASAKLPTGKTLRLRCDEPEAIVNEIFYSDWTGFEPELLPHWLEYAARSEIIVDVGAHIGHHSIVAALGNPRAKVIAFEPFPKIADMLRKNAKLNSVAIDVRQRALGREKSTLPLFVALDVGVPSSSSLSEGFMRSSGLDLQRIDVEVSVMDDEDIPPGKAMLKMDTETTEPDIVAGAHKFLSRKPVVFVEVLTKSDPERLRRELAVAGYDYTPYLLTDKGKVRKKAISSDPRWPNYLLIPK